MGGMRPAATAGRGRCRMTTHTGRDAARGSSREGAVRASDRRVIRPAAAARPATDTSRAPRGGDPTIVARRILSELWNGEEHARLFDLVDPDCAIDDWPSSAPACGRLLLLNLIDTYKAFVPDLQFQVEEEISESRRAMCYWSATGAHHGVAGGVQPTGNAVRLHGVMTVALSRRDTVEHLRATWDICGLIQQLGLDARGFDAALNLPIADVRVRAISRTAGVPLLFFPVMSLPGWVTWRRFIDVYKTRRSVVTFQTIGNRLALQHAPVPAGYDIRSETAAMWCRLKEAGIDGPFDVVGHSAGGTLALDFALEHPHQVRSLV